MAQRRSRKTSSWRTDLRIYASFAAVIAAYAAYFLIGMADPSWLGPLTGNLVVAVLVLIGIAAVVYGLAFIGRKIWGFLAIVGEVVAAVFEMIRTRGDAA